MTKRGESSDSVSSPGVSPLTSPESQEAAEPIAVPGPSHADMQPAEVPATTETDGSSNGSSGSSSIPQQSSTLSRLARTEPGENSTSNAMKTDNALDPDCDDDGFLEDDDDEPEGGEVFDDEPEEPTSKGKDGFRPEKLVTKFKAKRTGKRDSKSYWSSDDDTITNPFRLARPRQKVSPGDPKIVAPIPPGPTDTAPARTKKPKSKRRMRRASHKRDSSENSSSMEDVKIQPKIRQRVAPPELDGEKLPETVEVPSANANNKPLKASGQKQAAAASAAPIDKKIPLHLSIEDTEIFQRLDDEYENALEEREIGYMARYTSVRQSACFSVGFMFLFLFVGTSFFMRYSDWSVHDALLFSIYTITTVGYGNHYIPKSWGFQLFTILYIFVGIATLTIMVAQVYQCIALEASRAQHSRDKTEMARRGLDILTPRDILNQQRRNNAAQSSQASTNSSANSYTHDETMFLEDFPFYYSFMHYYEKAKIFFVYNEYGRSLSVLFPFAGLILIGAIVVGPIEGWSVIESLYFAVVSLTTVGFGDYYPRSVASIWFCILWLPFSVGFMSMFLKNVATFYIRLSAKNINRIERHMRKRLVRAKERAEQERAEALKRAYRGQEGRAAAAMAKFPSSGSVDGGGSASANRQNAAEMGKVVHSPPRSLQYRNFDALPTNVEDSQMHTPVIRPSRSNLFGSPDDDLWMNNRRERILQNSLEGGHDDLHRPTGQTMDTMKHVIQAVHKTIESGSQSEYLSFRSQVVNLPLGGHSTGASTTIRKPSFALRCLVQERFAGIIAIDIAGYQSSIEIKENTLSVTIDSLKDTADKWLVPRRARKAFRAVAFEALYFVGEHGLITTGADALFALTPFEFHGLFSPLLAAMGDADAMENWLTRTKVLAEVDLHNRNVEDGGGDGDVETGSQRSAGRSKSERLSIATNKIRAESSDSFDRVHVGNAFANDI